MGAAASRRSPPDDVISLVLRVLSPSVSHHTSHPSLCGFRGEEGSEPADDVGKSNTFGQPSNNVVSSDIGMTSNMDNLIDELPDDILVSILSHLSSKQVAQTSILSCRWAQLWTHARNLDFEFLSLDHSDYQSLEARRRSFISWVNNTLISQQGMTLDKFSMSFDPYEVTYGPDIDRWIVFALEKKARCLCLDLEYTLTLSFIASQAICFLEVVTLFSVQVSGEVVEHILSSCPLLWLLRVFLSETLKRVRVSGHIPNLKTLEIMYCPLEYIEISSAVNLVSFSYGSRVPKGTIKSVPNLVNASIVGACAGFVLDNSHHFSGFLSRLETLELDLEYKMIKSFPSLPSMKNLKSLELYLNGYFVESLLFCADILKNSCLLQRLTLKVSWGFACKLYAKKAGIDVDRLQMKKMKAKPKHDRLKVIEFIGFQGGVAEVELLLCLLSRAVSLKSLIIHPSFDVGMKDRVPCEIATVVAKQLKTRLPHGAELVIIELGP